MNNQTWKPFDEDQLTKSQLILLANQAGYKAIITEDQIEDLRELVQRGFVKMSGPIQGGCFIDEVTNEGHQYRRDWHSAYQIWLDSQ